MLPLLPVTTAPTTYHLTRGSNFRFTVNGTRSATRADAIGVRLAPDLQAMAR